MDIIERNASCILQPYRPQAPAEMAQQRVNLPVLTVCVLAFVGSTASTAGADVIGSEFMFAVKNQSIWGSGPSDTFEWSRSFKFEKQASFNPSLGPLKLGFDGRVEAGASLSLRSNGGGVDISYPTKVTVGVPDSVKRGKAFQLTSGWTADGASMRTDLGAPEINISFPFAASADLNVFGSNWRPSVEKTFTLPEISPANMSYDFKTKYVDAAMKMPQVNTDGSLDSDGHLKSSGSDDFAAVVVDLDALVTDLTGIPFGWKGQFNWGVTKGDAWAELLDLDLRLQAALEQEFDFSPELKVRYQLEDGQTIEARASEPIQFKAPSNGDFGPTWDIEAEYYLDATFRNNTDLSLDLLADLALLKAGGSLSVRWFSCKWFKCKLSWKEIARVVFGPAFDYSWMLVNGEVGLFDQRFRVEGFQTFRTTYSVPIATPEPATLALLGTGLLLALCAHRLRRHCWAKPRTIVDSANARGTVVGCVLAAASLVTVACATDAEQKQHHLERGNRFLEQKRYPEAVIEFRRALQGDEHFAQAQYQLAEAYAAIGDTKSALKEYVRAADLMPESVDAQLQAGTYLLLVGQFEDAKARAERVLDRDRKNVRALIVRANAIAGLQDVDGAVAELEQAIQMEPNRSETYSNIAMLKLAQGHPEQAEVALLKAVEIAPRSFSAWLSLANYHLVVNETAEAEAALQRALQIDSQNASANQALAGIYLRTGRIAAAEVPLKAIVGSSNATGPQFALADYYIAAHRTEDAIEILESLARRKDTAADATCRLAAITYSSDRVRAHQLLSELVSAQRPHVPALLLKASWLIAENKPVDALEISRAAVKLEPESAVAHYLLGASQAMLGQSTEAMASLNEVIRLRPRAAAAQLQLSRLHMANSPSKAAAFARDVLDNIPNSADARAMLARGLIGENEPTQAEKEIVALMKAHPESPTPHALDGSVRLRRGDVAGARRAYERALALDPASIEVLVGITRLDLAQHHVLEAKQRVEAQLASDPDGPELLFLAAGVYAAERDFPRAERTLRRVIELAPAFYDAYSALAKMYVAQGKLDAAREEFDQLASRDATNLGASTMAAIILQAQGNDAEAKRRYERVLNENPRAAVAANNLAWMNANEGTNLDQSLRLAQLATSMLPENAAVHDTLGWVYYRKDLPTQAIAPFEDSIRRNPENAVYHYHLALALQKTGDVRNARKAAERAVTLNPGFSDAHRLLTLIGD